MITTYQKRSNKAALAFLIGMVLVIISVAIEPTPDALNADFMSGLVKLLMWIAMPLCICGYYYGIWAYVLAKGQPARYGVILPFLGLIGLILLIALQDKAADPIAAEEALRKIEGSARIRWLRALRRPDWLTSAIGRAVAVLVLFEAVDVGHGEDYFTLLRWIVLAACAFTAYLSHKTHPVWTWVFAILALFFQPFIPVHLQRSTWEDIDLCASLVLLVCLWFVPGPLPNPVDSASEPAK